MATTYAHTIYLIPKFLITKRKWKFLLYSLYTLVLSSYGILLSILVSVMFLSDYSFVDLPPMSKNYSFIIILVYLVVAILSFIRVLQSNAKITEVNQALENQLLSNQLEFKTQELSYLKQQIHPHFLFNTLNSIYGHALKSSKETPDLIIKLSNILDYILYQVDKPLVSLSQEITHIEEYISLEKIRHSETLVIEFNKQIDQDIEIPPMLLLPFIENCFKHGRAVNNELLIQIELTVLNNKLQLNVTNSCSGEEENMPSKGIGINNIRQRLAILYPKRHELNLDKVDTTYNVDLHINLS